MNDKFVMDAWANSLNIEKVKTIPDGNGDFTSEILMLVDKSNKGFGKRSWRYSAILKDGVIEKMFIEEGKGHNVPTDYDPYEVSDPKTMLKYLKGE